MKNLQDPDSCATPAEIESFLEGNLAGEIEYMKEHEYRFRWIMNSLPASSDTLRLIDIGPTPQTFKIKELNPHYDIFALDRTDLLKERLDASGIVLKACNLDDDPIPFEDDYFDVVIFMEVLEHVFAPPSDVLKEIKRIMRKGGKLLISVPNIARLLNRIKLLFGITPFKHPDIVMRKDWIHGHGHVHEYTTKEITSLLASCGFKISTVTLLQPHVRDDSADKDSSVFYSLAKAGYLMIGKLIPNLRQTICIECFKP